MGFVYFSINVQVFIAKFLFGFVDFAFVVDGLWVFFVNIKVFIANFLFGFVNFAFVVDGFCVIFVGISPGIGVRESAGWEWRIIIFRQWPRCFWWGRKDRGRARWLIGFLGFLRRTSLRLLGHKFLVRPILPLFSLCLLFSFSLQLEIVFLVDVCHSYLYWHIIILFIFHVYNHRLYTTRSFSLYHVIALHQSTCDAKDNAY